MNIEEEIQVIEKIGDALYQQGQDNAKLTSESVTALAGMIQAQGTLIKELSSEVKAQRDLIMQLGENQKQLLTEINVNRYQINAAQDNIYNLFAGTIGYTDDAKRQVFLHMPKATGKKRLWQQITAATMYALDKECDKAGTKAFLIFGTLLGALRHKGFIPWDDDIDTAITDDGFAKLYDYIEKDADSPIRLDITYAPKSFAIQCRAVFKDTVIADCDAFSDVFPFHYITSDDAETFQKFAEIKRHLTERFRQINEKYADYLQENQFPAAPVGAMLLDKELETDGYPEVSIEAAKASREAMQSLIDAGLMRADAQTTGDPSAKAIKYSIYSYRADGSPLLSTAKVFPLGTAEFEGENYPAPRDADWTIRHTHGDYLTLPHDIHMSHEDLPQSEAELQAMLDTIRGKIGL